MSACQVLGLQMCAMTPGFTNCFPGFCHTPPLPVSALLRHIPNVCVFTVL